MHIQPVYNNNISLPVSEKIHKIGLSLPSSPEMSEDDIVGVSQIVAELYLNNSKNMEEGI